MKKSYFPDGGIWLKGNLHSHTTVSDGTITPRGLAEAYERHSYDFLSMTDHNVFVPHSELPPEQILLLTGVEHDIEYSVNKCTHVVGVTPNDRTTTSYPCKRYSDAELTEQQMVDMMRKDGQFVMLAHPIWSRMEPEEVLKLNGFHAIEVFNNGTEHLCHGGNAEVYWDMLLRRGRRVFATASDDVHVTDDLFGGWVCVKAARRDPAAILEALFAGAFYSSAAPVIYDFGMEDGKAYISCSDCREIHFVTYRSEEILLCGCWRDLDRSICPLTGNEAYVRAVCVDSNGRSAWTNPIFFDTRE